MIYFNFTNLEMLFCLLNNYYFKKKKKEKKGKHTRVTFRKINFFREVEVSLYHRDRSIFPPIKRVFYLRFTKKIASVILIFFFSSK